MVDRTRNQFVERVLEELREQSVGQAAASESFALVDERVPEFFDELETDRLAVVNNYDDAIPGGLFRTLAEYMALQLGPTFGLPRDEAGMELSRRKIQRLVALAPSYATLDVDYF